MVTIISPTLVYGLKPRWDSHPQKDEKQAAKEKVIGEYERHTRDIIEKLDQLRNRQINEHPGLQYTWIYTFQYFADLKDLLYHLYTDRRELFDLLVNAVKRNNILDPQFNSSMGELVRGVMAGGDHLKGCCNSCKRMFPADETRAFEQQFMELEKSELWNAPLGKLWLRKR
jgi:hypothetical protein